MNENRRRSPLTILGSRLTLAVFLASLGAPAARAQVVGRAAVAEIGRAHV